MRPRQSSRESVFLLFFCVVSLQTITTDLFPPSASLGTLLLPITTPASNTTEVCPSDHVHPLTFSKAQHPTYFRPPHTNSCLRARLSGVFPTYIRVLGVCSVQGGH